MKRLGILVVVVLAVLSLAAAVTAGPIGFALDTNQDLYSIDFGLGVATLIGPTAANAFFEGLASSGAGGLYATDTDGTLYSVDPLTGAATLIGASDLGNLEGLDFNGGTLLAADFRLTPSIYALDLTDGSFTFVVVADTQTGSARSMTTLDANTMLFRTDDGDTLRTIDLTTGATAILARNVPPIYGMDILSDGNLYGVGGSGELYSIDPTTGATTQIGDTGDHFWLALAAGDVTRVPEPASVLLLGLGLALLGAGRRSRLG